MKTDKSTTLARHLPTAVAAAVLLWTALCYSPVTDAGGSNSSKDPNSGGLAASDLSVRTASSRNRFPHGILALADPTVAKVVGVDPARARRIREIDNRLDKRAHAAIVEAAATWYRHGGLHAESAPDLRSAVSPSGRALHTLQRAAETEIAALLSPDEQGRWQIYAAARLMPRLAARATSMALVSR